METVMLFLLEGKSPPVAEAALPVPTAIPRKELFVLVPAFIEPAESFLTAS